ncbi:MAG: hypothetical protein IPN87_03800 [Saprospiraceae bacterium]|jgi:septal ring factor EnvC (AmiA/AmiB activator)|uniref:hypothetical protein n=1 Tax=Candidatus Brachybacter algidus TaxID=2982024 RepID=UPI001B6D1A23|nr:hypothetical protein [Candidatus Brachybacter algidus]MBP7540438.1 hypothetical protein [Saprospiraceae bacterium]MBK6447919.1 hypothetical protein [Candidatus Brachybacter algidus]MBK8602248.1 hypothetical protein [Candidatus Brachybacter algidus]MBK8844731.1 hypothetical protein [Candidatus Brachybacter algidus]MBK9397371.1 hypothetical protein [Candidatus Brachybacter algidus]
MNIQILDGEFKSNEAIELITQMIHIKIKYHENKISLSQLEEDIKARENKIKRLQKDLYEFRNTIDSTTKVVKLKAIINIDLK